MNHNMDLKQTIRTRRSIRRLVPAENLSPETIPEILREAMRVPSAFNMQSYRILSLSGKSHNDLWDLVEQALLAKQGPEKFAAKGNAAKIAGFRGGNGTLLFFEDQDVVEEKGNIAKSYKDTFPDWSQQGSGIIQYAVWLLLTEQGLAASLQHYSNLIEEDVRKRWDIPERWTMISQMPYGLADEIPGIREFIPFETMAKFYD